MKCVIIKHARKIVTAASSTWGRKMSCQLFKKRKKSMFYLYIRLLLKYTYMRLINKCSIYLENCTILLLWNATSKHDYCVSKRVYLLKNYILITSTETSLVALINSRWVHQWATWCTFQWDRWWVFQPVQQIYL